MCCSMARLTAVQIGDADAACPAMDAYFAAC
jgi:hypothetical protein